MSTPSMSVASVRVVGYGTDLVGGGGGAIPWERVCSGCLGGGGGGGTIGNGRRSGPLGVVATWLFGMMIILQYGAQHR